jgi:hypothetical protein
MFTEMTKAELKHRMLTIFEEITKEDLSNPDWPEFLAEELADATISVSV